MIHAQILGRSERIVPTRSAAVRRDDGHRGGIRRSAARAQPSRSSRKQAGRRAIRVYATSDDDSKVETKEKFTNAGAFKALDPWAPTPAPNPNLRLAAAAASSSSSSDPFATRLGSVPAVPAGPPAGFIADGVDRASLPPKNDADRLLNRFDRDQRSGSLAPESTPEGSPRCTHPPLRASCRALAASSSRVMMGICAPDAENGLLALKAWTADLGLPRGRLHGLDVDGAPVDPPPGPVFIKYNSDSGDAFLSGYGGEYRGCCSLPSSETARSGSTGTCPWTCPRVASAERGHPMEF